MSAWREELAWAAGFCDGESNIRVQEWARPTGTLMVAPKISVSQAHIEPLERLQALFGGSIYQSKKVYPPANQPMFHYSLSKFETIQAAIAAMWPWLGSAKRAQAVHVLRTVKEWRNRPDYNKRRGGDAL